MPLFVTVEEVAELLRVPRSRIYDWTRQRLIPAYRGGKRLLFDREEVLAWFKQTQRVENGLSPASTRSRRVLVGRRRGAPHRASGGRDGESPTEMRGLRSGAAAVARRLPAETARGIQTDADR